MDKNYQQAYWTEGEIKILIENYGKIRFSDLSKLIPRHTPAAIRRKAAVLHLSKKGKIQAFTSIRPSKIQKLENLSEFELGYIAGMIDGEGCIGANIDERNKIVTPYIIITNTDKKLMEWLSSILGYDFYIKKQTHRKTCYQIGIRRIRDIKKVLDLIKDKLIVKKEQAELMYRLCLIKLNKKLVAITDKSKIKRIGNGLTQEEIEIYQKLKELNKRKV